MKKVVIYLMLLTAISKIIGFFRDITLSYFYGASNVSDAYLISQTIPGALFSFIGAGIATSFIPIYNSIESTNGKKAADSFTSKLLTILFMISSVLVTISVLFTEQVVNLFASGFKGETLEIAINFTKISVVGIYASGLIYIFTAYLSIKRKFTAAALMGIPFNLVIVCCIILSYKTNIYVLTIGGVLGTLAQLLFLIPSLKKANFKYLFTFRISSLFDSNIKKLLYLSVPVIFGTSVNQINKLVDRTLASRLEVGAISALNYANTLIVFIQGIFVLSIVTVLYPTISKMVSIDNKTGFKKSLVHAVNSVNLLVVPATIGSMIFSEALVSILFGRGSFDHNAITMTSSALFFFSIGITGFGLREVLAKAFYSLHDTKTPMVNAALAFGLNIILNIILSKYMGLGGLALATSVSAIICTGLLFISLQKKIGSFGIKSIIISFCKILTASVFMGLVAKLLFNILVISISQSASLIAAIGIGMVTYVILIYFMKLEDVGLIMNAVKRNLKHT